MGFISGDRISERANTMTDQTTFERPATARYADLEIGSGTEMSVMLDAALQAAGAHDQADGAARDHTVQVGASG